jgi:hypothetical protein
MGIEKEAHTALLLPGRQLIVWQRLEERPGTVILPFKTPNARPRARAFTGTSRTAGSPLRAMTTSSPASARLTRSESCVLASACSRYACLDIS